FRVKGTSSAGRYENPWLKLEAPLADGTRLSLARMERCDFTSRVSGRTRVMRWEYQFEDTVELGFASPRVALDASLRPAFKPDEGLSLARREGAASRWAFGISSDRRWHASISTPAPEGSLDGLALTMRWIEVLAKVAGLNSPRAPSPASPATAGVW